MNTFDTSHQFWHALSELVRISTIVVDRPAGSHHPRYPDVVYPIDYGYLAGTTAGDGAGIDIWVGSLPGTEVTGAVCTIDAEKRDAEIKVLLGCTPEETGIVLSFHSGVCQSALLLLRPENQRRP